MDNIFPMDSGPEDLLDPDERRVARRSVRDAIVRMRRGPGDFIDARTLSRKLDLPLLAVQEALLDLAECGLVTAPTQWGAYVSSPSRRDLQEIDELRNQLEAVALQRFTQRATEAQLDSLRRCLEALEFAVATQQGPSAVLEQRDTFCRIILRVAECPSTAAVLLDLRKRMEVVLTMAAADDESARLLGQDLRAQYEALRDGDVHRAVVAAQAHIQRSSSSAIDRDAVAA